MSSPGLAATIWPFLSRFWYCGRTCRYALPWRAKILHSIICPSLRSLRPLQLMSWMMDPFRLFALVFVPEYPPDTLVAELQVGLDVSTAIARFQAVRQAESKRRFDRLVPARPQLSMHYATFLAFADWFEGTIALFDCTRYNGTAYSVSVPPVMNCRSLLSVCWHSSGARCRGLCR